MSVAVSVLEADGTSGVADEFVELPWTVYRDDPVWIPEDPAGLRRRFSAENAWFARGEARWWCIPGVARLAAFFVPGLRVAGKSVAYFGLWETTGDVEANRGLFTAAESWARARHAEELVGPIDFTTFSRYRLLTGGNATARPFLQEPYNPPSYPGILRRLGYAELPIRYFTHVLTPEHQRRLADRLAPDVERVQALGYRLQRVTPELWMANLPALHSVCDAVFGEQFAYTPLSYDEFTEQCGERFIRRIEPDASVAMWAPDGTLVGFALNYPDWSPLLTLDAGSARLRPDEIDHAKHLELLRARPQMDWLGRTGGILPAHRGHGAMGAMGGILFRRMVDAGAWDRSVFGVGIVGNGIDHILRGLDVTSRFFALYCKELA